MEPTTSLEQRRDALAAELGFHELQQVDRRERALRFLEIRRAYEREGGQNFMAWFCGPRSEPRIPWSTVREYLAAGEALSAGIQGETWEATKAAGRRLKALSDLHRDDAVAQVRSEVEQQVVMTRAARRKEAPTGLVHLEYPDVARPALIHLHARLEALSAQGRAPFPSTQAERLATCVELLARLDDHALATLARGEELIVLSPEAAVALGLALTPPQESP